MYVCRVYIYIYIYIDIHQTLIPERIITHIRCILDLQKHGVRKIRGCSETKTQLQRALSTEDFKIQTKSTQAIPKPEPEFIRSHGRNGRTLKDQQLPS